MSISNAVATALSGLNVTARKAEIVSSNVSNALTEGYGRRSVSVSSADLGGVRIDGVSRHVNEGVIRERRLAEAGLSAETLTSDILQELSLLFGEIGQDGALSARFADLEQALVTATADPGSDVRLNLIVDQANAVTRALNATSDGIQSLRMRAEREIATQVEALNSGLTRIADLNADISRLMGQGLDPSSLMDQRQRAIDDVARIVPLREMPREHGQLALMSPSGVMLLDGRPSEFGFTQATLIVPSLTVGPGGLSELTLNGTTITDGAGRLGGGTLGAAFALRDDILPEAQTKLDAIARDMIARFSDPATDPSLTPGTAGLFTDAGTSFDPADTAGIAGRIALNSVVDPEQGGSLSLLRDGLAATTPGPVGSTDQLNRWLEALRTPQTTHLATSVNSVAGHIGDLLADIGGLRVAVEKDLVYQTARFETLKEAELADGVDTDVELQSLLQIEQAYAANAKVLQTVDALMRTLMEL